MTYTEIIKEHLEKYGSITSKEAINKYGNTRLSATIYILRSQGLNIITDYETSKNRYGEDVCFKRYYLADIIADNMEHITRLD